MDLVPVLIGSAATVTAASVIYQRALKPAMLVVKGALKAHQDISAMQPVLVAIVKDFKPNGGKSLRDVIDRIENRQIVQEARHNTWLTLSPDALYECNSLGLYVFANRSWCELTGVMSVDALFNGWINAIHPDDQERVMRERTQALEQRRDFTLEYKLAENGTKVTDNCIVMRSAGKVVGFIGKLAITPVRSA